MSAFRTEKKCDQHGKYIWIIESCEDCEQDGMPERISMARQEGRQENKKGILALSKDELWALTVDEEQKHITIPIVKDDFGNVWRWKDEVKERKKNIG